MLPQCSLQTVGVNSQDTCLQGEWQEPPPALPACRHGPGGKYREKMTSFADDGLTQLQPDHPGVLKRKGVEMA